MTIRPASDTDLDAVCQFGATHIPEHYAPLLGQAAAQAQVHDWWTRERMLRAIDEGRVVVAEAQGELIGIAEWSLYDGIPVIWKLYVHPRHRGGGIGPQLVAAVISRLPEDANRVRVETFAVNERALAFYRREGFREINTVEHPNPVMRVVWLERSLR